MTLSNFCIVLVQGKLSCFPHNEDHDLEAQEYIVQHTLSTIIRFRECSVLHLNDTISKRCVTSNEIVVTSNEIVVTSNEIVVTSNEIVPKK